jgi:hypothetical protein
MKARLPFALSCIHSMRYRGKVSKALTTMPHVHHVAALTRTVTTKGTTHQEVVFLVTSRSPRRATAAQLLARMRRHWSIEVRHHVSDVTFGEDRFRLRHGHAPQLMAACRNLRITLLHRTARANISAARRSFAYHPAQALALLIPKTRHA